MTGLQEKDMNKRLLLTATTTHLSDSFNGKMALYLGDLANPKIGLD